MLLTIRTTDYPTTALGYLQGKSLVRAQRFDLRFGGAPTEMAVFTRMDG